MRRANIQAQLKHDIHGANQPDFEIEFHHLSVNFFILIF